MVLSVLRRRGWHCVIERDTHPIRYRHSIESDRAKDTRNGRRVIMRQGDVRLRIDDLSGSGM
jgi:hypothetical protein